MLLHNTQFSRNTLPRPIACIGSLQQKGTQVFRFALLTWSPSERSMNVQSPNYHRAKPPCARSRWGCTSPWSSLLFSSALLHSFKCHSRTDCSRRVCNLHRPPCCSGSTALPGALSPAPSLPCRTITHTHTLPPSLSRRSPRVCNHFPRDCHSSPRDSPPTSCPPLHSTPPQGIHPFAPGAAAGCQSLPGCSSLHRSLCSQSQVTVGAAAETRPSAGAGALPIHSPLRDGG